MLTEEVSSAVTQAAYWYENIREMKITTVWGPNNPHAISYMYHIQHKEKFKC